MQAPILRFSIAGCIYCLCLLLTCSNLNISLMILVYSSRAVAGAVQEMNVEMPVCSISLNGVKVLSITITAASVIYICTIGCAVQACVEGSGHGSGKFSSVNGYDDRAGGPITGMILIHSLVMAAVSADVRVHNQHDLRRRYERPLKLVPV